MPYGTLRLYVRRYQGLAQNFLHTLLFLTTIKYLAHIKHKENKFTIVTEFLASVSDPLHWVKPRSSFIIFEFWYYSQFIMRKRYVYRNI